MVEFGNVPAATKIAIILIGIGFIVFVVGFGAPYWTVFGILGHEGLWQRCWTFHGTFRCFSNTGAQPPPPPTPLRYLKLKKLALCSAQEGQGQK